MHASRGTRPRLIAGLVLAVLIPLTVSCSRRDADRSQTADTAVAPSALPGASAASATRADGIAAPYAAIVPADAQPPAPAASGGNASGTSTAGAETSASPSAGPGNGSTAVGGQAGGQAAGGSPGGTPAKTSGDGR